MPDWPTVSFIIPVKNEAATISDCLDSLLALDYPSDKIEILIADGNSTDNTRAIVTAYMEQHDNIILLDNPDENTAIGRNICIQHATGDLLMNFSGHADAPPNLLKVLAGTLAEQPPTVAGVGCSNLSPKKQNFVGEAAGASFLGFMAGSGIFMQNAVFDRERYVKHMAFTLYRRQVFDDVGLFDPAFWCGQDAELDIRIRKAGYKILYTPKTAVKHFKRDTIRGLFRQLYRYGIARIKMIKKHPDTKQVFHYVPSIFLIIAASCFALWIAGIVPGVIIAILILIYCLLSFISTARVIDKPAVIISSVLFYLLIKVAYGTGFLRGLIYHKW